MKHRFVKSHTKLCILAVLLSFCIVSVAVYYVVYSLDSSQRESQAVYSEEGYKEIYDNEDEFTFYNGVKYRYKKDLQTVLFMGIDKTLDNSEDKVYRNGGQSDVLFLTVIDKKAKSFSVIQINRDTMTEINILGESGKITGTAKAQIALSYAYGDGKESSCKNTVEAVENLFLGIHIEHYCSVSVDSVPYLNDLVGGVTVTVKDDFSNIDKSLVNGETLKLTGKQAYEFIRYRYGVSDQTNISRMARHRQYATSFINSLQNELNKGTPTVRKICSGIFDKTITDLSEGEIIALANNSGKYKRNDIIVPHGSIDDSKEFVEFNADETSITDIVLSVFYEKAVAK